MELSSHFQANDAWNPAKILAALDLHAVPTRDADVQVLTDGAKPATNAPRATQNRAKSTRGRLGVIGCLHVWGRGDLDQRQPQAVEVVRHTLTGFGVHGAQFPRAVLFEADDVNANWTFGRLQGPVLGDQGGPLEAAGVRAVHHGLAHGLHEVNRAGLQQGRDREGHVNGVGVERKRGALVEFDEARIGRLNVFEAATALGLETSGHVDRTAFAARCPQSTVGPRPRVRHGLLGDVVQDAGLAGVEFPGGELLMHLDAAHEAQRVGVQRVGVAHLSLGLRHAQATHRSDMSATVDLRPPSGCRSREDEAVCLR